MPAGSRSAAQSAGGRKKDEIWDLVKNVEKVISKDGKATSEKRWACKFCDRTLQGGPNIIMAHHGVHGSGKKKDVQRCMHAPPDAGARRTSSFAGIVRNAVQSTEFWQEVDIFVTVLQRIYVTLRANDSAVPGTPDIYFRISSGLADVQTNEWELPDGTSFKFSAAERKVVLDAYKQR